MDDGWELYLGIDWGTFKTAIVYHLRYKNSLLNNVKAKATTVLWANTRDNHTSSQAAYDPITKNLLYGHEVQNAIDDGLLHEPDRIENIKVLLTDTHDKKPERERLLEQLDSLPPDCPYRNPDELIKRLFELYYGHALEDVGKSHRRVTAKHGMAVRCAMGVPASWGRHETTAKELISPATRLRKIAIDAGMGFLETIPEQEAAAICLRHNEANGPSGLWPHTNSSFIVLDGGGTTNVSYQSYTIWLEIVSQANVDVVGLPGI